MEKDNIKEQDDIKEQDLVCSIEHVHRSIVDNVQNNMTDEDLLYDVAELFKVFGDSTRTKILSALACDEMCVCDIAELLKMTKSAVSHQLRILRGSKLVKFRRSGKEVIYSLADEHVVTILNMAIEHIQE